MVAPRTAKLGLRNSDGCKVSQPRSIQRLAPKTSLPVNSTSAEPITASAKTMAAVSLIVRMERIEVTARMPAAIAANTICLAA